MIRDPQSITELCPVPNSTHCLVIKTPTGLIFS